jgi:DNA-binding MarR family transcriptional regulator
MRGLTHREFANLLAFRTSLRRFNRWSEAQARRVGLTHAQHQVLLVVKGHDSPLGPTIGDVAEHLLLRHHSAVELVNRVEQAGLVERMRDPDDGRVVRLRLTEEGDRRIAELTELHIAELARLAPALQHLTGGLSDDQEGNGGPQR